MLAVHEYEPCVHVQHIFREMLQLEVPVYSFERNELQYYSMEQPHHFPLASETSGDACETLGKTDSLDLNTACPS